MLRISVRLINQKKKGMNLVMKKVSLFSNILIEYTMHNKEEVVRLKAEERLLERIEALR